MEGNEQTSQPSQPPRKPRRRARTAIQLPSGRHGLPASFVAKNQRDRILMGMARGVREVGYPALSVEGVISRAGVSRRTFYDLFKTKEEAYLEAYDEISGKLFDVVAGAYTKAGPGGDRLRHSLAAFLEFVAREPDFAHMCVVDVLAAGHTALERRDRALTAYAELFDAAAPEQRDEPAATVVPAALVGGIYEVVYRHVLHGRTAELPALLPDLYYFCLLPYHGRTESRARYEALVAARE